VLPQYTQKTGEYQVHELFPGRLRLYLPVM
jgi:hypothetical protein